MALSSCRSLRPPESCFSFFLPPKTVESVFSSRVEFLLVSKLLEQLPFHIASISERSWLPPNKSEVSTASTIPNESCFILVTIPSPPPIAIASVNGSPLCCTAVRTGQLFQSSIVAF